MVSLSVASNTQAALPPLLTLGLPALLTAPLLSFAVQRLPERIIEHAVKGMLPKGRLGRDIRLHLKVYKGTAHPHEAQQPTDITKHISAKPKDVAVLKQ